MPRATETLLPVMLPSLRSREGIGTFLSFPNTAPQCTKSGGETTAFVFLLPSAIMNCATNAVNATHHELGDKSFILIAEYLLLNGALAY